MGCYALEATKKPCEVSSKRVSHGLHKNRKEWIRQLILSVHQDFSAQASIFKDYILHYTTKH